MTDSTSRLEQERAFFNKIYEPQASAEAKAETVLDRYYRLSDSRRKYTDCLSRIAPGATVLELGCGVAKQSFSLAKHGVHVHGIDISDSAVTISRKRADELGLSGMSFSRMDAEALSFEDGQFDYICGEGIIHHLSVERVFSEIARTLKPGGTAIFIEPMAHNPLLVAFRALTPQLRTVDEHPLRTADFRCAERFFDSVEVTYFDLLTLFSTPLLKLPGSDRLFRLMDKVDSRLFATIAPVRRWAGFSVLELTKASHG